MRLSTGYQMCSNLVRCRTNTTSDRRTHATNGCVQPSVRLPKARAAVGDVDLTVLAGLTQIPKGIVCGLVRCQGRENRAGGRLLAITLPLQRCTEQLEWVRMLRGSSFALRRVSNSFCVPYKAAQRHVAATATTTGKHRIVFLGTPEARHLAQKSYTMTC